MKAVKSKKCKCCKVPFIPFRSTDQVCSLTCALSIAKTQVQKQRDIEAKKVHDHLKQRFKEKFKTITEYENEAKAVFQKFIRLRDKDLPCISCGSLKTNLWDGGHYKNAGYYSGVIFNEWNCNKQCRYCNMYLSGNELNYREGLIRKIGIENVETLEQLAVETRYYKWTKEQLTEIKNIYALKIKQLK